MHHRAVDLGAVLVGGEGGEGAGIVLRFGGRDDLLPILASRRAVRVEPENHIGVDVVRSREERVDVVENGLLSETAAKRWVVAATLLVEQTQELRVLAHRGEIERPIELPGLARNGSVIAGDVDGAAFGELISFLRTGQRVEPETVERHAGVHMGVSPEHTQALVDVVADHRSRSPRTPASVAGRAATAAKRNHAERADHKR